MGDKCDIACGDDCESLRVNPDRVFVSEADLDSEQEDRVEAAVDGVVFPDSFDVLAI